MYSSSPVFSLQFGYQLFGITVLFMIYIKKTVRADYIHCKEIKSFEIWHKA